MKKILVICLFLIPLMIFSQNQKYSRIQINLSQVSIDQIASLGIPIEGEMSKEKWITELSQNEINILTQKGIPFSILIDDMSLYYQKRNSVSNQNKNNSFKNIGCSSGITSLSKPVHFKHGSLAGYLNLNELYQEMDSMHILFPNLASARTVIDTFHSTNGLPLNFIKISKNANVNEDEPRVLYVALTHAREPMGMQQLVWFMWYMLENYGVNEEVAYLLDHAELYFIPCSNPDGYFYNQTTDPNGGGMWRKNRRNNGGGTYGVDLNRNYGYEWGYDNQGSSPTTSSDVYRGPSAFSENETKAIKWLAENRLFKLAIDHHCYSNILLFPWGYQTLHTPDHELFLSYSRKMTSENHFAYGVPGELLYTANGGTFDWYYGEQTTKQKIIAFSPEAGTADDGFWPQESRIDDIALDFFAMNLYLARFAYKYGEVEDKSPDIISDIQGTLPFEFVALGLDTNAVFKVTYQALSSNITSFGNPITFTNPNLNTVDNASMSYSLTNNTASGDEIVFVISLQIDQLITYRDTIRKIFGQTETIFYDSCNTVSKWTSAGGNWVTTNTTFVSPSTSICDSPGNYTGNLNKRLTLNQNINLTHATWAKLNFYARWDLEKSYDFVKIEASIDSGITWEALCGKYTVIGSENQEIGTPCYDGTQTTWVLEEMDINELLGEQVKFRFVLKSDALTNGDGFYFDDFKVSAMIIDPTSISNIKNNEQINIFPNPSNGEFNCNIADFDENSKYEIVVFDAIGRVCLKNEIRNSQFSFNIRSQNGIFMAKILKNDQVVFFNKLILIP